MCYALPIYSFSLFNNFFELLLGFLQSKLCEFLNNLSLPTFRRLLPRRVTVKSFLPFFIGVEYLQAILGKYIFTGIFETFLFFTFFWT